MDEAKRLNMLDGHFFWLWIDASMNIDIFHSTANKTQFADDIEPEIENLIDKKDRFDRSKRDDADNNTINKLKDPEMDIKSVDKILIENINEEEIIVKNREISTDFEYNSRINRSETHTVNNKLLDVNYSQSYISNRNIMEDVKNNYVDNDKGVESSKVKNYSIEKRDTPPSYSNSRVNKDKRNESFNKYVNSIHVDGVNDIRTRILEHEKRMFNEEITDIKDKVSLASDISDFLLNPTVHTFKMHTLRDTIEKRSDKIKKIKPVSIFDDETGDGANDDNVTVIINSLPVGLLALHPQPMKIGKICRKNKLYKLPA